MFHHKTPFHIKNNSKGGMLVKRAKNNQVKEDIANKLFCEIKNIDQRIAEVTKGLIDAQAVSIRSSLSSQNNLYVELQKKWFGSLIKKSVSWHSEELLFLYKERQKCQGKLDQIYGKVWTKRIRRWFILLLLVLFSLFIIWIILMGIITALYLLPIWGTIILAYFLIVK